MDGVDRLKVDPTSFLVSALGESAGGIQRETPRKGEALMLGRGRSVDDGRALSSGDHVHAAALPVEHDLPVDQCEKCVVIPLADACSSVEFGTDLADDDVACTNRLTAKFLDAATLRVGIAAVTARTLTLFMCHVCLLENQ